jgi:hypothetical protein
MNGSDTPDQTIRVNRIIQFRITMVIGRRENLENMNIAPKGLAGHMVTQEGQRLCTCITTIIIPVDRRRTMRAHTMVPAVVHIIARSSTHRRGRTLPGTTMPGTSMTCPAIASSAGTSRNAAAIARRAARPIAIVKHAKINDQTVVQMTAVPTPPKAHFRLRSSSRQLISKAKIPCRVTMTRLERQTPPPR